MSTSLIARRLAELGAPWQLQSGMLVAEWEFARFAQVATLTRAVLDLSAQLDHHPQVSFGYRHCRVAYKTHSCDGLSELDFHCAAQIGVIANQ